MNMSLRKTKSPHKTGSSSTQATEMEDNCFQVCHCSVNEFVLFFSRVFLSFHFSALFKHFFWWFFCLCFPPLSGLHIYPLIGSLDDLSLTFPPSDPSFLSPFPLSSTFLVASGFFKTYLCFPRCSLSLFCLLTIQENHRNSSLCNALSTNNRFFLEILV